MIDLPLFRLRVNTHNKNVVAMGADLNRRGHNIADPSDDVKPPQAYELTNTERWP